MVVVAASALIVHASTAVRLGGSPFSDLSHRTN